MGRRGISLNDYLKKNSSEKNDLTDYVPEINNVNSLPPKQMMEDSNMRKFIPEQELNSSEMDLNWASNPKNLDRPNSSFYQKPVQEIKTLTNTYLRPSVMYNEEFGPPAPSTPPTDKAANRGINNSQKVN